jgi:hypothetical protein
MKDIRERPVCHRAEDLVSYLYGEAGANDALDFRQHLQSCDACRNEYAVFNQVHDSIQIWRNEALGASLHHEAVAEPSFESTQFVHHERKLSALSALREFFNVSPLWLRGVTAFAAVLLIALTIAMVARISRKPVDLAATSKEKTYTRQEVDTEVNNAVERTLADLARKQNQSEAVVAIKDEPRTPTKRPQVAANQTKSPRPRSLNRQEREQLAADLRLTPSADEDELLLAFPEQDKPRQ